MTVRGVPFERAATPAHLSTLRTTVIGVQRCCTSSPLTAHCDQCVRASTCLRLAGGRKTAWKRPYSDLLDGGCDKARVQVRVHAERCTWTRSERLGCSSNAMTAPNSGSPKEAVAKVSAHRCASPSVTRPHWAAAGVLGTDVSEAFARANCPCTTKPALSDDDWIFARTEPAD